MVTLQLISLRNLQTKDTRNDQSTALMFRDSLVNANHGVKDQGPGKATVLQARSIENLPSPERTVRRIRRIHRKGTVGPRTYNVRIVKR